MSKREPTPFDIALSEAIVYVLLRCGGSGGRCRAIYGAVVDDPPGKPAFMFRHGAPCHHHVNPYTGVDLETIDRLTEQGRVNLAAGKKPAVFVLRVRPGRQPTPGEQARQWESIGRAELHEFALDEGPRPVAFRPEHE